MVSGPDLRCEHREISLLLADADMETFLDNGLQMTEVWDIRVYQDHGQDRDLGTSLGSLTGEWVSPQETGG